MQPFPHTIIYINLDHRTDRRAEIEQVLSTYSNDSRIGIERFPAILNESAGIIGCTQSHLAVLRIAKERGLPNILILEDDFMPVVSTTVWNSQMEYLQTQTAQMDVCMISYNLIKSEYYNAKLTRVKEAQTASGYLIWAHYYDTLIECLDEAQRKLTETGEHWNYANDQYWKRLQMRDMWLCFTERLGIQRPSYSDNSREFTDYGV